MKKAPNDRYVRMYGPLLDVLREMGGEGKAREVARTVADRVVVNPDDRNRMLKSGGNAAENEVAWARDYLKRLGFISAGEYGVWRLTPAGHELTLSIDEARQLRAGVHQAIAATKKGVVAPDDETGSDVLSSDATEVVDLLSVVFSLPASGFEKLCRVILQRSGIEDVKVTGKSGDGGIDGIGVLRVNAFVSFKVLFQCKKYAESVGSASVRDFRGAMQGRTDKGIILTTGYFTKDAREEAVREGVPPIELVDGAALVDLMERLEIGVKPRTVYDVDETFFEPFRKG